MALTLCARNCITDFSVMCSVKNIAIKNAQKSPGVSKEKIRKIKVKLICVRTVR